jgi:hypothetical protein
MAVSSRRAILYLEADTALEILSHAATLAALKTR